MYPTLCPAKRIAIDSHQRHRPLCSLQNQRKTPIVRTSMSQNQKWPKGRGRGHPSARESFPWCRTRTNRTFKIARNHRGEVHLIARHHLPPVSISSASQLLHPKDLPNAKSLLMTLSLSKMIPLGNIAWGNYKRCSARYSCDILIWTHQMGLATRSN